MPKYMVVDATGMLPAFYAEDLYGPVVLPNGSANPAYPTGGVEIGDDVWQDFLQHQGRRKWNAGTSVFDPYTPPAQSAPLPTVTGNQWAFALSDMGLSSAWRIGVTKSKDSDQVRVGLIARDTPLVASDPLLIRIAANAGLDASGNPLVSVPAVFVHAQGMPT